MSIHYKGKCTIVSAENIFINVPTETKINKTQPHVVVRGFCNNISFENTQTVIT